MLFNKLRIIIALLFFCISSCKEPKTNPPSVEFDFSEMPDDYKIAPNVRVIDNDQLFSEKERSDLELLIEKLQKERNTTIYIFTDPSKIQINKEWHISRSPGVKGLTVIISRSNKSIDLGVENNVDEDLIESVKEKILLEFHKGNYYAGVKQIIDTLINHLGNSKE